MSESHEGTSSFALSPALLELLAVFEGPLADVRFPGVDKTVLRTLVDQVQGHGQKVEALRVQLEDLQSALTEAQLKLVRAAEQGLGYARVFAASDPVLADRLAEIVLTSGEEPRRRRKLEVAAAEIGNAETLRLPAKRGRKPNSSRAPALDSAEVPETGS